MAGDGPRFQRRRDDGLGGTLEYGLRRKILLAEYAVGRKLKSDVCDAHPDLLRAAKNKVGKELDVSCPICEAPALWQVTYVFGKGLPASGSCPSTKSELTKLLRREEPVTCFDVEVCPSCAWHHLLRRYPAGGHASRKRTAP